MAGNSFIADIKKRAGLKESEDVQYELHVFNRGNSRPFVSEGDAYEIAEEVKEILGRNQDGSVAKLTIVPIMHGTDTLKN